MILRKLSNYDCLNTVKGFMARSYWCVNCDRALTRTTLPITLARVRTAERVEDTNAPIDSRNLLFPAQIATGCFAALPAWIVIS